MCGGFTCTKNALKALNLLYMVLSLLFIIAATYLKTIGQIGSDKFLIGGLITFGVFIFLLSLLGLIGTAKHHQVMLFFYMVILFLTFVAQFSIACVLLASNPEKQEEMAEANWCASSSEERQKTQEKLDCCGFYDSDLKSSFHCPNVHCCQLSSLQGQCIQCDTCKTKIRDAMSEIFIIFGWFALFFSLTEFMGVWLTIRFRNQKNPRANSNAFL